MRRLALFVLGFGLLVAGAPAQAAIGALPAAAASSPIVKVGYWCSPGFVASYGRCVATASTDQVELYLNEPGGYDQSEEAPPPRVIHRRKHRALHERY